MGYQLFFIGGVKVYCGRFFAMLAFLFITATIKSQTAEKILQEVKSKLEKVNEYEANGKMRTNVAFIKAPIADVKIYYKKPNMLRIVNENGISFIPRGSVNISLDNIFSDLHQFDIIDGGKDNEGSHIIKLLPRNDTADVVLSVLYIDDESKLVKKSKSTTRENGTYELSMTYGKYSEYGLPDKIVFSFNTKDYRLPKGITLDYDDGTEKNNEKLKNRKGTVEITYSNYRINKGIDSKIFQK
ncbi:MAG TPA: hypothetical protein VK588_06325 [Chitinophagaceae bacterium]|nr:hypothetical protein [Chitinophagaceae bacterium]